MGIPHRVLVGLIREGSSCSDEQSSLHGRRACGLPAISRVEPDTVYLHSFHLLRVREWDICINLYSIKELGAKRVSITFLNRNNYLTAKVRLYPLSHVDTTEHGAKLGHNLRQINS